MNDRRIKTEEEYQNTLKWLLEKAEQLEHPLLDDHTRAKLMRQYDFVSDRVLEYQQRESESDPEPKETDETQDELTDWLDDE